MATARPTSRSIGRQWHLVHPEVEHELHRRGGYAWGAGGDVPIVGDFDGDGRTDVTVYRPSSAHWFILKSSTNFTVDNTYQWGATGDIPMLKKP